MFGIRWKSIVNGYILLWEIQISKYMVEKGLGKLEATEMKKHCEPDVEYFDSDTFRNILNNNFKYKG